MQLLPSWLISNYINIVITQPAIPCSKLTIETLEQAMFNVNNKDTRTTPMAPYTYFTPCSSVSNVNFEHVNAGWVLLYFTHLADVIKFMCIYQHLWIYHYNELYFYSNFNNALVIRAKSQKTKI